MDPAAVLQDIVPASIGGIAPAAHGVQLAPCADLDRLFRDPPLDLEPWRGRCYRL
jgi:hypothetical protein